MGLEYAAHHVEYQLGLRGNNKNIDLLTVHTIARYFDSGIWTKIHDIINYKKLEQTLTFL